MIKAVGLDWDNTCIHSWEPGSNYIIEVSKLAGIRVPEKSEIKPLWGNSYEYVARTLWPNEEDYNKYMNLSKAYPVELIHPPIAGIHETLEKIAGDYVLTILTLRERDSLPKAARDAGIDLNIFECVYTKDDLEYHKPDPRVFEPLLNNMKSLGISKENILYVDDSILGYIAAKPAGLNFFGVTTGVKSKEDFMEAGLDEEYILDSIIELPEKLNRF